MKIYIYTIPKAGTYFLADFIERLGFHNTGFHVSRTSILNTRKLDLETNARFPSKAKEKQFFMKTMRELKDGDIAFGHLPMPLMASFLSGFCFVCAYRHPRKTLMSEFIDFRFRRQDIAWISPDKIPDDTEAFCHYLEQHGKNHIRIFSQMIGVSLLLDESLCEVYSSARVQMFNFDQVLSDPAEARRLATHLGADPDIVPAALEQTKQTETKTKATGLEIDRGALWSDRAEEIYAAIDAEAYVRRGRELGWTI